MDGAGDWPRAEARRLQWAFIRRQLAAITGFVMVVMVATLVLLAFIHSAFQRGLIVGAAIVGTLSAIAMLVMQVTGTAPKSMGQRRNEWTASELRPLRRRGWQIVNHFSLRANRDIDHVMVGPDGVVAVETKWSAQGWTLEPPEPRVARCCNQARDNAKVLALWHPLRSLGIVTVRPACSCGAGEKTSCPMRIPGCGRWAT